MITKDIYEQIESYVAGRMSSADKAAFEQQLLQNQPLAEEIRQHQLLMDGFDTYSRRTRMKKHFDFFHKDWKEESKDQPFIYTYGARAFWRRHLPTVAVAASVAIVTVFSTIFMTNYLRSLEHRQVSSIQELRRENKDIRKTLNVISEAVSQQQGERQARFSGTGFMISANGYIVTNRHVVEGADSVYVEAVNGSATKLRYKVQVLYTDLNPGIDLALLKITDSSFRSLARMPYALRTREADLGEMVYTLAYPREDMVFGEGSISSHTGYQGDTSKYQISVPVNPGNSGAPLLDAQGNLIGIISSKNTNEDGAAFAVKSKHLLTLLDAIPADSLPEPVLLPRRNSVAQLSRPEQIKKLQSFVFNVKVYKK